MASTQTRAPETVHKKLVELRIVCDGNIVIHQHKVDSYVDSFGKSLQYLRSQSEQSAHNQVIDCCPHLNGTDKMVNELNKSNDLFNFVRIMREKCQTAASGSESRFIYQDQDTASISLSAPVSSVSADSRSGSPPQLREVNGNIKKVNHRKGAKLPVPSPSSASSLRRTSRLMVKNK